MLLWFVLLVAVFWVDWFSWRELFWLVCCLFNLFWLNRCTFISCVVGLIVYVGFWWLFWVRFWLIAICWLIGLLVAFRLFVLIWVFVGRFTVYCVCFNLFCFYLLEFYVWFFGWFVSVMLSLFCFVVNSGVILCLPVSCRFVNCCFICSIIAYVGGFVCLTILCICYLIRFVMFCCEMIWWFGGIACYTLCLLLVVLLVVYSFLLLFVLFRDVCVLIIVVWGWHKANIVLFVGFWFLNLQVIVFRRVVFLF